MKQIRRLCAVTLLTVIFALHAFADGQMPIPAPKTEAPSTTTQSSTTLEGTGQADPMLETFLNIVQSIMFLV